MASESPTLELTFTPHGVVAPLPYRGDEHWDVAAAARFAEHEAAGLTALAAATLPQGIHVSVLFWRDVAAHFVRTLCHIPDSSSFTSGEIDPATPAMCAQWTLNAPPMQGAEYLTPDRLGAVWERLRAWTVGQVAECGGLGAFLETYAPQWARVGRVTLHLAENKGDAEFPFALMATYATGLSRSGKISRLPLARALQEYAGAGRYQLGKGQGNHQAPRRRTCRAPTPARTGGVRRSATPSPALPARRYVSCAFPMDTDRVIPCPCRSGEASGLFLVCQRPSDSATPGRTPARPGWRAPGCRLPS